MQNIPEKIDSKFRFVLLAAYRAEQMMRGAQPKITADGRKVTRVALQEVMDDAVGWDYGPEVVPDEDGLEEEAAAEDAE